MQAKAPTRESFPKYESLPFPPLALLSSTSSSSSYFSSLSFFTFSSSPVSFLNASLSSALSLSFLQSPLFVIMSTFTFVFFFSFLMSSLSSFLSLLYLYVFLFRYHVKLTIFPLLLFLFLRLLLLCLSSYSSPNLPHSIILPYTCVGDCTRRPV